MGEVYDETLGAGEAYGWAIWIEPLLEMEERCGCSLMESGDARLWPWPEPGRNGGVGGSS